MTGRAATFYLDPEELLRLVVSTRWLHDNPGAIQETAGLWIVEASSGLWTIIRGLLMVGYGFSTSLEVEAT